jgi:hypothetical protein
MYKRDIVLSKLILSSIIGVIVSCLTATYYCREQEKAAINGGEEEGIKLKSLSSIPRMVGCPSWFNQIGDVLVILPNWFDFG